MKLTKSAVTEEDFVKIWYQEDQSPTKVAKAIGVNIRNVYERRRYLESKGYDLPSQVLNSNYLRQAYKQQTNFYINNGSVVIVSDRHKWPNDGVTFAEAALYTLLPKINPDVFIFNGDLFDGANLSRHPPLGWEEKPSPIEEITACKTVMDNIENLLTPNCLKIRTVGNHDRRYDYYLAKAAGEYKGLFGTRLSDHFPNWDESWSVHINSGINGGHTVVKHKHRQGVGAARNNAMSAGVTIVTGHTHALSSVAVENYTGRYWGVECGYLSHAGHPAFEYTEDGPSYARPGFAILTYRNSVLQPPELVEVDNAGVAWFRGEPITLPKPRIKVKAKYERIES